MWVIVRYRLGERICPSPHPSEEDIDEAIRILDVCITKEEKGMGL